MSTAAYNVAICLQGLFRPTSLMSVVHRSRLIKGLADDVTKCSTVCLQRRNFSNSCISPSPCQQFSSRKMQSHWLFCDNKLNKLDFRYNSNSLFLPWIQIATSYSTKPDVKENESATGSSTKSKSETTSAADKILKGDTASLSGQSEGSSAAEVVPEEQQSVFQRFKKAYKEHGKVLIAVHVATSIVWFGSFYTAARLGIDIVPLLEKWNFSETFIKPFRAGGLGDIALAYLMYKLATPARYTVTLAGTNFAIRYLRRTGKMPPKSKEDSLRQLYREGRKQLKYTKLRTDRIQRIQAAKRKKHGEGGKRYKLR